MAAVDYGRCRGAEDDGTEGQQKRAADQDVDLKEFSLSADCPRLSAVVRGCPRTET